MKFFTKFLFLVYFSLLGGLTFADAPERTASDNKNQKSQVLPSRQTNSNQASTTALNQPFSVDYQGEILYLEEGQIIHPLCNSQANTKECVSQWSHQAVPLMTQSPGNLPPTSSYHLPAFIPTTTTPTEEKTKPLVNPKVWEKLSRYSAGISEDGSIEFYKNKDTGKIKRVTKDGEEDGYTAYIPEDAVGLRGESFITVVGTHAFPAQTTKEAQEGCFVFEKESPSTEADYCYTCQYLPADKEDNLKVFFNEVKIKAKNKTLNARSNQNKTYEEQICSAETTLKKFIKNFNNERSKCEIDKVYSSAGETITNISDSAVDKFEAFFEISYCASCSQDIPVELMMAMMSVESVGKCNARSPTNDWGVLQINIPAGHKCVGTDLKEITHIDKKTCFLNPINNLYSSINVVKDYRDNKPWKTFINPSNIELSTTTLDQCNKNSWLNLDPQQRDVWRRLVSGYNSGPGHIPKVEGNWEILREKYFDENLLSGKNSTQTGRSKDNTRLNLVYTEAILGRETDTRDGPPSLVEIWHQYKLDFIKKRGGKINCIK